MQHFDAIVIGTGAVGSAALFQLAKRGARVLGIDRFDPPHDRGSSHGETRMIRQAYFEHPNYVPLLLRAYELWDELQRAANCKLFEQVGLIEVGPHDGVVIPGVLRAARAHSLAVEQLTAPQIEQRFPGLRVPKAMAGVYEPTAGFLYVEKCIAAYLELARAAGAQTRTQQIATIHPEGHGVRVQVGSETFTAEHCLVTAGAWAGELLADLGLSLKVRRQSQFWYRSRDQRYSLDAGMPCFFYELPAGCYYGFPALDELGLKVACHSIGSPVKDPAAVDRSLHVDEQLEIEQFLADQLPQVSRECLDHRVCLYTMTPDEHFTVDRHPEFPQIVFAAGLSGHGFKFSGVLGETLADLALDGKTTLPIDFLSLSRFNR